MATTITGSLTQANIDALDKMMKNQTEAEKTLKKNQALDKDAFLRMMTKQLQYQDPMNPVSDKDSIAQLAQFSQLEQSNNMAKSLTEMSTTNTAMLKAMTDLNTNFAKLAAGSTATDTDAAKVLKNISDKTDANAATSTQLLNEMIKMNKMLEAYLNKG